MARVALVTGGTRGIGAAISKALKAAGYKVAASYAGNDAAAEKFKAETGIPVYKLTEEETAKLLRMEEELHKRVIGQEEALKALSRAIRRTRAGLKDPKRPSGSFIFLGPTGVGKTELAKAVAEFLFGHEKKMIRVDMSEYQDGAVAVDVRIRVTSHRLADPFLRQLPR